MSEIYTVGDIVRVLEEKKIPQEATTINWTKYFDRICCFHYLPQKDRLPIIERELKRVGILDSGIFEFHYSFPSPFDAVMRNAVELKNVNFTNEHARATTNMTIAFYGLVKRYAWLGYERVLVLEDDVLFIHDLRKIKVLLDHMPNSYDFIQFDRAYKNEWYKQGPDDGYFMSNYVGGYTSACCNAFSHKALELAGSMLEKAFYHTDRLMANIDEPELLSLNRYVAMFNIVKQDDRRYDDGYRDLLNFSDFYPRLS